MVRCAQKWDSAFTCSPYPLPEVQPNSDSGKRRGKTGHRETGLSVRPLGLSLVSNTSSARRTEPIKGTMEGKEKGEKGQGDRRRRGSLPILPYTWVPPPPCLWEGEGHRASQGRELQAVFEPVTGLRQQPQSASAHTHTSRAHTHTSSQSWGLGGVKMPKWGTNAMSSAPTSSLLWTIFPKKVTRPGFLSKEGLLSLSRC